MTSSGSSRFGARLALDSSGGPVALQALDQLPEERRPPRRLGRPAGSEVVSDPAKARSKGSLILFQVIDSLNIELITCE